MKHRAHTFALSTLLVLASLSANAYTPHPDDTNPWPGPWPWSIGIGSVVIQFDALMLQLFR